MQDVTLACNYVLLLMKGSTKELLNEFKAYLTFITFHVKYTRF